MTRDVAIVGLVLVAAVAVLLAGHASPLVSGIVVALLALAALAATASGRL
jgi:hypothetical protein